MNWKKAKALEKLNIKQVPFDTHKEMAKMGHESKDENNLHGYSFQRDFAINPNTPFKSAAAFHEIGHIILGHTTTGIYSTKEEYLAEMEACAVSILCMKKLGVSDYQQEAQREHYWGHRQVWQVREGDLPADFKAKVNRVANEILEAGTVEEELAEAA